MYRGNMMVAIFILLYISYFLIVCGPVGGPKYRIPIEPVLIILQSYTIIWVLETFKKKLIFFKNKRIL